MMSYSGVKEKNDQSKNEGWPREIDENESRHVI